MDVIIRYNSTYHGRHTASIREDMIPDGYYSLDEVFRQHTLEFDLSHDACLQLDLPLLGVSLLIKQSSFRVVPFEEEEEDED